MNKTSYKSLIDELIENGTDNITEDSIPLNNNVPFF